MKATCWMGKKSISVNKVPDPQILNDRDAIIKVTSTAICGSDLHLYNGFIPSLEKGDILGHEFMGEVVQKLVGSEPLAKVKDDLRHFKQRVETGEVPRSGGSPEGEQAERKLHQRPAQPLDDSEREKAGVR